LDTIVLLVMLGFLSLVSSCHSEEDYGQRAIDKPGIFSCFGGALSVTVSERPDHQLNYTVATKRAQFGPSKAALRKDFLIYSESPTRVWIFDGDRSLNLVELTGDASARFTSSEIVPGLVSEAPPLIKQRIHTRR
jgi:hypothetical protein